MKQHRQLFGFLSALGMAVLILDGKTALSGAAEGIDLCIRTVIPALFPFFVLSSALLRSAVSFHSLETAAITLYGLPRGTGCLVLPCFLGGYPVGAKSVHQLYAEGLLRRSEAERLLAFCNNAGPAFVFGVISQSFPKIWMPWALWGIHLAGAWIASRFVPCTQTAVSRDRQSEQPKGSILSGVVITMGVVCGWIILFRILIAFLDKWFLWLLPQTVRVALVGILELSNGCCELANVSNINSRFLLCSGMLAVGGLCVTAQTISVTQGLSLRSYCLGKLIQTFVSLLLSYCLMYRTGLPLLFLLPVFIYGNRKKRGRNRIPSGV